MVWYDFVMLGILVYAAWQGAARGLVMQLAWIVAIVLCFKFADKLSPQIEPMISVESEQLRHWIAMFILYLGFSLGSFLVARTLSNAIEKAKFQDFDRQLGGLFGLLKGALLSLVVTFFAVTLSDSLRETVLRSKTGHIACLVLDNVRPMIPEDAHPLIRDSLERYQNKLGLPNEDLGEKASPQDILADHLGDSDDFQYEDTRLRNNPIVRNERPRSRDIRGTTYQDFLSLLPDSWRASVGDSLLEEWAGLSAQERSARITELRINPESAVGDLLRNWYQAAGGQGSDSPNSTQSRMIDLIADAYPQPDLIVVETQKHLAGVPADIREAVLNDWYADITMADRDPDPRTDINTRLDDRILNQMRRIGVAFEDLSYGLQERLRRSMR